MKIFVYNLRDFDEKKWFDKYCGQFGIEYEGTPDYPTEDNVDLAAGAEVISIIPCPMGKDLLERFASVGVRHIAARSIGLDHIDLAAAEMLGIKVTNAHYSPSSVANYAILMMLSSCRRYTQILRRAALQVFTLRGSMGREFSDCTVGIIGSGSIGKTVIRHLQGFGCRILVWNRSRDEQAAAMAEYVPLEMLLAESDIISLHLPGKPELFHFLGEEEFRLMKNGVILVNTARGSLIDEDALIANLQSGKVGYAALDTIEEETGLYYHDFQGKTLPGKKLNILRSLPNVDITPHMAFYTEKAVAEQIECVVRAAGELG